MFVDPVKGEILDFFVFKYRRVLTVEVRCVGRTDGAIFRLSRLDRWLEMERLDLRPATDDLGEPFPLHSAGDGALPLEVCVETVSAKSSD